MNQQESNFPISPKNNGSSLYNLEQGLFAAWANHEVDQIYQKVMLAYLDELPQNEAKKQILKETKKLFQNKSQYNIINNAIVERKHVLNRLSVQTVNEQQNLQYLCSNVDNLRKCNLVLLEAILKYNKYVQKKTTINAVFSYKKLLKQIDTQNNTIKNSILNKYVKFGKAYDPLFVTAFENYQKSHSKANLPLCVSKLFNMNISYVYRLMTAKNQILKNLSGYYTNDSQQQMEEPQLQFEGQNRHERLQQQVSQREVNRNKDTGLPYPHLKSSEILKKNQHKGRDQIENKTKNNLLGQRKLTAVSAQTKKTISKKKTHSTSKQSQMESQRLPKISIHRTRILSSKLQSSSKIKKKPSQNLIFSSGERLNSSQEYIDKAKYHHNKSLQQAINLQNNDDIQKYRRKIIHKRRMYTLPTQLKDKNSKQIYPYDSYKTYEPQSYQKKQVQPQNLQVNNRSSKYRHSHLKSLNFVKDGQRNSNSSSKKFSPLYYHGKKLSHSKDNSGVWNYNKEKQKSQSIYSSYLNKNSHRKIQSIDSDQSSLVEEKSNQSQGKFKHQNNKSQYEEQNRTKINNQKQHYDLKQMGEYDIDDRKGYKKKTYQKKFHQNQQTVQRQNKGQIRTNNDKNLNSLNHDFPKNSGEEDSTNKKIQDQKKLNESYEILGDQRKRFLQKNKNDQRKPYNIQKYQKNYNQDKYYSQKERSSPQQTKKNLFERQQYKKSSLQKEQKYKEKFYEKSQNHNHNHQQQQQQLQENQQQKSSQFYKQNKKGNKNKRVNIFKQQSNSKVNFTSQKNKINHPHNTKDYKDQLNEIKNKNKQKLPQDIQQIQNHSKQKNKMRNEINNDSFFKHQEYSEKDHDPYQNTLDYRRNVAQKNTDSGGLMIKSKKQVPQNYSLQQSNKLKKFLTPRDPQEDESQQTQNYRKLKSRENKIPEYRKPFDSQNNQNNQKFNKENQKKQLHSLSSQPKKAIEQKYQHSKPSKQNGQQKDNYTSQVNDDQLQKQSDNHKNSFSPNHIIEQTQQQKGSTPNESKDFHQQKQEQKQFRNNLIEKEEESKPEAKKVQYMQQEIKNRQQRQPSRNKQSKYNKNNSLPEQKLQNSDEVKKVEKNNKEEQCYNQTQQKKQDDIANHNAKNYPQTKIQDKTQIKQKQNPNQMQNKLVNVSNVARQNSKIKQKVSVQLKSNSIKISQLFQLISKSAIKKNDREVFEVQNWKRKLTEKQCYLTQFYYGMQLAAFGISSPLVTGDYSILYWGSIEDNKFSDKLLSFLFKKYLDYLQKFTSLQFIYLQILKNEKYEDFGFNMVKDKLYKRKRISSMHKKYSDIDQFFLMTCSNICFVQKNKQSTLFYSEQIEKFTNQNSLANLQLVMLKNKEALNDFKNIQYCSKNEISNIQQINELNKMIEEKGLDTYAAPENLTLQNIKISYILSKGLVSENFFVSDGFFMTKCFRQTSQNSSQILIKICMKRNNYNIFFGRQYKDISSFVLNCKKSLEKQSQNKTNQMAAFKMFSKMLYGRIPFVPVSQQNQLCYYGNWDISFTWQDQLKGLVSKQLPKNGLVFGPQSFYVAIFENESDNKFIYALKIQQSDFLY